MFRFRRICLSVSMIAILAGPSMAEIPQAAKQDPRFKLGYVVVTAYEGVKNDGTGDSTKGIQQAIEDAYKNRLTVLFPAGEYLISDSLKCYKYQLWSVERAASSPTIKGSASNPTSENHLLLGEANGGGRPVIRLAKKAKGFDDPNHPRPMISFRNFRATSIEGAQPAEPENPLDLPAYFEDATPNLFGEMLCNIDFDCGANPGAIGAHVATAQDSMVMNVRINAEGAFAGFHGLPGRNSVAANIEVQGGRFGIISTSSLAGPVVVGARLFNQTEVALDFWDFSPLALVGFEIRKENGPAILVPPHPNTSNGAMSLLDGRIEIASGGAAIDNKTGKTLYLRNVYVKGADTLVQSGEQEPLAGRAEWNHIKEYSYADQTPVPEDDPPFEFKDTVFPVHNVIDGKVTREPEAIVSIEEAATVPEDLLSRHLWERLPIYASTEEGVINATDVKYGAKPNDDADDVEAIQKAIDDASTAGHGWVFLPAGDYHISRTLELKANTILTGAGMRVSRIHALPSWRPAKGESATFLTTVDDPDATTVMAFLSLVRPSEQYEIPRDLLKAGKADEVIPPSNYFITIDWRAGRNSMTVEVETGHNWAMMHQSLFPVPTIQFSGNGGGKHYTIYPRPQSAHLKSRGVLITGTHEPLSIYGLNSEKPYTPKPNENTGLSAKEWGALYALETNVEVKNAKNVRIYGMKREGLSPSLIVRDSENVALFSSGAMRGPTQEGFGGYVQFEGKCKNVMATVLMTQTVSENIHDLAREQEPVLREALEGQEEIIIEWPESVAVYKRGELDDSMFSRMATSATGPAE